MVCLHCCRAFESAGVVLRCQLSINDRKPNTNLYVTRIDSISLENLCMVEINFHFATKAPLCSIRRRRQCVVSEDRSVASEWPLLMAERHRSAALSATS